MTLHNKHFLHRQEVSTKLSYELMEKLFNLKKIKFFQKAVIEADKSGIDYFFRWTDGDEEPNKGQLIKAQFKNREDKYQDVPISRFQPFYGVGHQRSKDGRDYRALRDNMNDVYLTAIKPDGVNYSEILVINSTKLFNLVLEAEKEWFSDSTPWAYIDALACDKINKNDKKLKKASNGVEAWFKRTKSEKAAKINMYVPRDYVDYSIKIC